MPSTVLATTLVTLKNADGSVTLTFVSPNGTEKFRHVIPAADFTSINTTTNGGATGATQTFTYAQDNLKVDYPASFFQKES